MAKRHMSEAYVELNTVRIAEKHDRFCRKVNWQGIRNAPDHVFAHESYDREIWIEFKKPEEGVRRRQSLEHGRMELVGMSVHVCSRVDDACKILGLPIVLCDKEGWIIDGT
jgi:hypothetical protein